MFHQQSSINVDPNLAYLRNKELQSHYKKINEIKSRKNKFVEKKVNWTSQSKKRIMNFDLNQIFNINRDNKVLYNKLLEISSREKNRAASHSTGKSNQVKNNLQNYKKQGDDDINNIYMNNPLMNDYLDDNNGNETDDHDEYNSVGREASNTVLPSIYMNNPGSFKFISPDDFEPFEKIARNTKGFTTMN